MLWLIACMTNDQRQPQDKYVVRFPDGMRDRIAEAAKAAGRSMNAEIVARLEASFRELDPNSVTAIRTREGLVSAEKLAALIAANLTKGRSVGGTLLTGYDLEQETDEPGKG